MSGNSVNPVNPIGQFFQPVSPENHTDGMVMVDYLKKKQNIKDKFLFIKKHTRNYCTKLKPIMGKK
ncbi:hypothetical protein BpHYR1_046481 [Brachionus plicatilis]|uniref:Uncharacterized protein n=1 Tax=Brachionus plicatilis TaxID=10195 RepID=A0A3M7RZ98_BRAPC|nr:hypothetical protein BpHYR1_046481 [Brachionus plicatilis]